MENHIPVSDQTTISSLLQRKEVRQKLVREVRGFVRTDEEAEDVVHEVLFSALQRNPEEIRNPLAYLSRACWLEAKGIYRGHIQSVEVDDDTPEEGGKRPDAMYETSESESLVKSLVQEFCASLGDPLQGKAFALRMLEGWSYEEIAVFLQVPQKTVGTWIFRAKCKFQKSKAFTEKLRAYTTT